MIIDIILLLKPSLNFHFAFREKADSFFVLGMQYPKERISGSAEGEGDRFFQ
jgi:hypothetical protein